MLSGKVRVGRSGTSRRRRRCLHVQKRGRFTNNMDFANFVVVAVASDDPRIQGTCMVILEEGDEGTFDRGTVTHKLVHQLTSTRDPVFDMRVPASRIVGGYTIQDGVIVPNYNHAQILEAVFSRTRVPAGVMTGAKLLSSVEPIIRYQRERFRGGEGQPGTPRHDLGLQTKEDALHRLVDIWAAGEAACSPGLRRRAAFRFLRGTGDSRSTRSSRRKGCTWAAARIGSRKKPNSWRSSTCGCASHPTTSGTTRAWPNWPRAA